MVASRAKSRPPGASTLHISCPNTNAYAWAQPQRVDSLRDAYEALSRRWDNTGNSCRDCSPYLRHSPERSSAAGRRLQSSTPTPKDRASARNRHHFVKPSSERSFLRQPGVANSLYAREWESLGGTNGAFIDLCAAALQNLTVPTLQVG